MYGVAVDTATHADAIRCRDLEDAAQAWPDAIWPGQAARALRALIHTANMARGKGLTAVPDEAAVARALPQRRPRRPVADPPVITAIRDALAGNPWMPPIPA